MTERREERGRLVRDTWIGWAREQDTPKPSWLAGWEETDAGQREVDMRIGDAVAGAERAAVAAMLRRAAAGRREYARQADEGTAHVLEGEALAYESAADMVTGALPVTSVIPSWTWSAEERALLSRGADADAG